MFLGKKFLILCALVGLGSLVGCRWQPAPYATTPSAGTVVTTESQPTAAPTPLPDSAAGFQAFLAEVEGSKQADRQYLVNRYLAQLPAAPITNGNQAIFLWQGVGQKAQVVGDMTGWDAGHSPTMTHLAGTDLWYLAAEYEADARLDYKFVIDGQNWQLDPLNPQTIMGGFGPNSELVMPAYQTPPGVVAAGETGQVPAGTLTQHTLDSVSLGQTRTFYVYTPPGQLVGARLPTVVFHDGGDYVTLIDTPAILDRLIAERFIPPLLAVFVPPIQRDLEYNRNDAYVAFLADEIVPFVQDTYDTDPSPARTGTAGASMGGLAAVYAAVSRPDAFGLALGQSGAYSLDDDAVINRLRQQDTLPVRLYLAVGTYETAVGGDSQVGNLLAANRRLVELLQGRFYDFRYEERPEGHSWGLWRGTLGRGLAYLYSGD
ncbi:MAG: alpha/beta hydrolase-fold protein [Chloroflexota bacterium]